MHVHSRTHVYLKYGRDTTTRNNGNNNINDNDNGRMEYNILYFIVLICICYTCLHSRNPHWGLLCTKFCEKCRLVRQISTLRYLKANFVVLKHIENLHRSMLQCVCYKEGALRFWVPTMPRSCDGNLYTLLLLTTALWDRYDGAFKNWSSSSYYFYY